MNRIESTDLPALLKQAGVGPRLRGSLRFRDGEITDWSSHDFIVLTTKSGNEGVFVFESTQLHVVPFTIKVGVVNTSTGKTKPIICDFCYTWQRGGSAASITFCPKGSNTTTTFLCCADLLCSLHVRSQTPAALESRTQIREDVTDLQRIARLQAKLLSILSGLRV